MSNTELRTRGLKVLSLGQRKLSSPAVSAAEAGADKSAAERKKDENVDKATHRFRRHPSTPPGRAGKGGGGENTLSDRRISAGAAAARRPHFQRLALIEKICFHLGSKGEGVIALSRGDEEERRGPALEGCRSERPGGGEKTTEVFNGQMQSGLTTKLAAERANGPPTPAPPTACQEQSAFFFSQSTPSHIHP